MYCAEANKAEAKEQTPASLEECTKQIEALNVECTKLKEQLKEYEVIFLLIWQESKVKYEVHLKVSLVLKTKQKGNK